MPGGGPSISSPYAAAAAPTFSISGGSCGERVRDGAGSAAARIKCSCGGDRLGRKFVALLLAVPPASSN